MIRRFAAALLLVSPLTMQAPAARAESIPPEMAPSPRVLLAANEPVDDSDLADEETLKELNDEEIGKSAWSTGAAVGLSLIPGGGFGLIYAEKKPHSVVPFLLSAAGYTVGALYMAGIFDTSKSTRCVFDGTKKVPESHCYYALDQATQMSDIYPTDDLDNHSTDPNDPTGKTEFYDNGVRYGREERGEDFDGQKTGLYIMAATYGATTLLGAIWSGLTVADHNEEIRKSVESTAQAPTPVMGYDGEKGYLGMVWSF